MKTLTSLILSSALCVGAAHGSLLLVNFGSSAYTSDGTSTWQTFNLDDGNSDFNPVAATVLNDSTGSASGITLAISDNADGPNRAAATPGPTEATFNALSLPGWFDSSSAEQRESFTLGGDRSGEDVFTITFAGFAPTDAVLFEILGGRSEKADERKISLGLAPSTGDLIAGFETGNNTGAAYDVTTGFLTGATSYSFLLSPDQSNFSGGLSAIGVTVRPIPEPSTIALFAVALALLGIVSLRRRRK